MEVSLMNDILLSKKFGSKIGFGLFTMIWWL